MPGGKEIGGGREEDSLTFKEKEVSYTISRKTIDRHLWMRLKKLK